MDLPDQDNVARFVSKNKLIKDDDGVVVGLFPQAFELRDSENDLSVNWLEYFNNGDELQNLIAVVKDFRLIFNPKNGAFAVANVGEIKKVALQRGFKYVKVVHSPVKPGNLSHSSVIRLPRNDNDLMLSFSMNVFSKIFLNRDIP